jgi:putative SOS response-associated peptidase YedK
VCGRFTQSFSWEEVREFLNVTGKAPNLRPRYNLAPSEDAAVVRVDRHGNRRLHMLRWGLVPYWSPGPSTRFSTINARAETVAEKPAFREAYRRRRCLVPADGFYEWQSRGAGKPKQPYWIGMADRGLFAFAGLWDRWQSGDEIIRSFTIIVTDANALTQSIHDRMPVIVDPADFDEWLLEGGRALLKPYPADKMRVHPVGTHVNKPENDDPSCKERVAVEPDTAP